MSILKEKYRQFRQWQECPFEYRDAHDHHGCCNCGAESENNYCPRCGQKAVYGPITWRSVGQGILDVWGVGTRSLPFTLWQLLWRPGYLMRDYISGKRQVSFPPVKMLVIMGVVALFIDQWVNPEDVAEVEPVTSTGLMYFYDVIANWAERHYEWTVLIAFSFIIVPVWVLFREAPGYPRHTLPQGFFIQVFCATQFLLVASLFLQLLSKLIPFFEDKSAAILLIIVVPCMLLIDYKQLFGYGWWGTLWRVMMTVPFGVLIYRTLLRSIEGIDCLTQQGGAVPEFWENLMIVIDVAILMWLMAEIVGMVNRKSWIKLGWWRALKRPLLVALLSLMTGSVCYQMGVKGAIHGLVSSYIHLIE